MTNFKLNVLVLLILLQIGGCALPIVAVGLTGAAVGTVVVVKDRRTLAVQQIDEKNEWQISKLLGEILGSDTHINVTSYNKRVLLTGEIPIDKKQLINKKIAETQPGVIEVLNDLTLRPTSSLKSRASDTWITSRVKSALTAKSESYANIIKVVTERGSVYLMGIVTEEEAEQVIKVARTVPDVFKVVSYFEIRSKQEIEIIAKSGSANPVK